MIKSSVVSITFYHMQFLMEVNGHGVVALAAYGYLRVGQTYVYNFRTKPSFAPRPRSSLTCIDTDWIFVGISYDSCFLLNLNEYHKIRIGYWSPKFWYLILREETTNHVRFWQIIHLKRVLKKLTDCILNFYQEITFLLCPVAVRIKRLLGFHSIFNSF